MPYPSFSQTGVTSVVFPRGPTYAPEHTDEPGQIINMSEGKLVRVATLSAPEELIPLAFELVPRETVTAVRAFLRHALVNWAAHPYTYTDVEGVAVLVRCMNASFTLTQTYSRLYSIEFSLRVEV